MDGKLQEFALPIPEIFLAYIDEDNSIKRLGEPLTSCHPEVCVNGINLTMDKSQMWIGEMPADTVLVFHFECSVPFELKGIRLWNYNAGREESCSGKREIISCVFHRYFFCVLTSFLLCCHIFFCVFLYVFSMFFLCFSRLFHIFFVCFLCFLCVLSFFDIKSTPLTILSMLFYIIYDW